jgi:hypothetical protein
MQRAVLNRATIEVANTTDISGRVTAESINDGLHAKKQSSHCRMGASQWVLHGTHSGSFMDGTPPTGRTVAYPLTSFVQVEAIRFARNASTLSGRRWLSNWGSNRSK